MDGGGAPRSGCRYSTELNDVTGPNQRERPNDSVPETALSSCLRDLPTCVILRNEDDLFGSLERGGDLDLLVADLEVAERTLIRHLGKPVRMIKSSYVRGYSYDWGHIDLMPTIEWRGACYLRTDAILDGRQISERGRPVPRLAHEAVISWLTSVLFGGFFKQRYAAQLRRAIESDGMELQRTLIAAAGNRLGRLLCQAATDGHPEIAATWTRSLRRSVWMRAWLKSPIGTAQRCGAFVLGELRRRFKPPVPWIAIVGADVRATECLARAMVDRFSECRYARLQMYHWTSRPKALIAYWTRLVHLRAKGEILAIDSTDFGALSWLLPKPDLVFVVAANPHRREHQAHHVLNGSAPLSTLVDEVQSVIRTWLLARTAANLSRVDESPITAPTASAAH
jgi:hypothetical protein